MFLPPRKQKDGIEPCEASQCDLLLCYGGAREPPHTSIINGFVVALRPGLLCFCVILSQLSVLGWAGSDEQWQRLDAAMIVCQLSFTRQNNARGAAATQHVIKHQPAGENTWDCFIINEWDQYSKVYT